MLDDDFTVNTTSAVANTARWRSTAIVGTGYVAPLWGGTSDHQGAVQVRAQGGAGSVQSLDQETAYSAGNQAFAFTSSGSLYLGFRLAMTGFPAALTSAIYGWGQVGGMAYGVDWITDPDAVLTPLAATNQSAVVFHMSSSAYGGAGAGELWARFYEQAGNQAFLVDAAPVAGVFAKYEVFFQPNFVKVYKDGVYINQFTELGFTSNAARISVQSKSVGASARFEIVDWIGMQNGVATGNAPAR
jgi:hypothetical protein